MKLYWNNQFMVLVVTYSSAAKHEPHINNYLENDDERNTSKTICGKNDRLWMMI
jgi:hypothetical protein